MRTILTPAVAQRAAAWDALVDQAPLPSPFLRSWWLDGTVKGSPWILMVLRGDALIGGVALEVVRRLPVRELRLIGADLGADHCDIVAAAGHVEEVRTAVRDALRDLGRGGGVLTDLAGLVGGSLLGDALPWAYDREDLDVAPYVRLPKDYESYLEGRSPGVRRRLRQLGRQAEQEGVRYEVLSGDQVRRGLSTLLRLHDAQWGAASAFTGSAPRFARAALAGAARGEMVLHALRSDEQYVAVWACAQVAGTVSYVQGGRDTRDPRFRGLGRLLVARMIERAIADGAHEFDFLRGDDGYKYDFADRRRSVVRLTAASGVVARAVRRAKPVVRRLRALTAAGPSLGRTRSGGPETGRLSGPGAARAPGRSARR